MPTTPRIRQPLATAIATALLVVGVTGTTWATSTADSHHPRTPAQTSPRSR